MAATVEVASTCTAAEAVVAVTGQREHAVVALATREVVARVAGQARGHAEAGVGEEAPYR